MKILFSFLLLISFPVQASCTFKKGLEVYSLSGPVTKILEELGIIHQVKGISVFYPPVKSYRGEIIPGGVFLSQGKLSSMKKGLVFFDQSQDLRKALDRAGVRAVELFGRNKTPSEVVESVEKELTHYLEACDFRKIKARVRELEEKIKVMMNERLHVIFFLGEVSHGKLPELVMANDGIVLWLRRQNLISTYPSELAYVNWSGSIMETLRGHHLLLGLRESKLPKLSGDLKKSTLSYPGALIPGLHQLEAWVWFLEERRKQ